MAIKTRLVAVYVFLGLLAGVILAVDVYCVTHIASLEKKAATQTYVQQQVGDTNLTRLADQYIAQKAQTAGYVVEGITILRVDQKANQATVTARVTITDGTTTQTVELKVSFTHSTWQATGLVQA